MRATTQPPRRTRSTIDRAEVLAAGGDLAGARRLLADAARATPDGELWRRLVALHHEVAVQRTASAPPAFEPPRAGPVDPLPVLPALPAAELNLRALRDGIAEHGCVLVRGLLPEDRVHELRAGIDRALAAYDEASRLGRTHDDDGWYAQFTPAGSGYRVGGRRQWVRASGALWTADSPRMFVRLLDLLDETGIGALVTDYLGERPALSANKCTLRRVPLDTNVGWHQDGSFLGEGVRSVNLWLALGDCGRDAPGMDIVPRRVDRVVETGTPGAMFDWSVAPDVVAREAAGVGIVRPEFRAGDALLFDHLLLHSTCVEPTMTRERHAMETWLFAPSSYPAGQIPLAY